MVIVVKGTRKNPQVQELIDWIEQRNISVQATEGTQKTILGLVGDTSVLDIDTVKTFPVVEDVKRIQEPYKRANRKFHREDTVVEAGGVRLGGGNFQVIAGPCSVESEEQMCGIAREVQAAGARLLRGGAFKPRTSPYAFQGLKAEGIEYLTEAGQMCKMPIVTEIMSASDLELFHDVDIIQVGARNMQNFALLRELGKQSKPVLLKRGLANSLEELLMSAEYIMAGGNPNVILCERGIRTFETSTRNTLDISAVPVLKRLTHLPVVVDPSHASGHSALVEPLALAAVAAGADGLMIEVHNQPQKALCDGAQSLDCGQFAALMKKITALRALVTSFGAEEESV